MKDTMWSDKFLIDKDIILKLLRTPTKTRVELEEKSMVFESTQVCIVR